MRLPLVLFAMGFAVGIGASIALGKTGILYLCVAGLAVGLVARRNLWILLAAASLLGMCRYCLDVEDLPVNIDGLRSIEGAVVGDVVDKGTWKEFELKSKSLKHKILVRGTFDDVIPGSLVTVTGDLMRPEEPGNPGEFDYASYLKARGIRWILYTRHGVEVKDAATNSGLLPRIRSRVKESLRKYLTDEAYPLYVGLLLGDKTSLDPELGQDFSKAGLGHLLAVSGLHVGFVTAGSLALSRVLGLREYGSLLAGLATLGYCLLAGAGPSVVRATVMALSHLCLGRRYDGFSALALASIVILSLRPYALLDVGFQLSFTATWGILYLSSWLSSLLRPLPRYGRALSVTLAAQLAIIPLVLRYFGFISLVSLLTNPLLVPFAAFMVLYGLFLGILGAFLPLPFFVGWPASVCSSALQGGAHWFANLPWSIAAVPMPSWGGTLFWFLTVWALPRRNRAAGFFALAFLLLLVIPGVKGSSVLEVTVLDVGQGDAIVLLPPGRGAVLIDGGFSDERKDLGRSVVLPYLRQRRISSLEAVFLTHAHQDHIGGVFSVLKDLRVKRVLVPTAQKTEAAALLEDAHTRGARVFDLVSGDRLNLPGGVLIQVLHPPKEKAQEWDLNESSLVLRVVYGDTTFLLTGDLEGEGEEFLLGKDLSAQVLKVGHHGSRNGTTDALLRAASPVYAVISTGRNSFGHPHAETLSRLASHEVRVWRTDEHGAVTFLSDGSHIAVAAYRSRNKRGAVASLLAFLFH